MLQDRLDAARIFLGHIHLQVETVKRVNTLEYLGSALAGGGELDAEVPHSGPKGWQNWKRMCGVLGD